MLSFKRTCQTIFQVIISFYISTSRMCDLVSMHRHKLLVLSLFFILAILLDLFSDNP